MRLLADIVDMIGKASVREVAIDSPLQDAKGLAQLAGARVLVKREDLQPIHSFKIRGAYNRIAALSAAERARGVLCASAGNHGQGVALAAERLGVKAQVVMPCTTPSIKVEAVRARGAEVILHGDHYSEAQERCQELQRSLGAIAVHPFDDPWVIAGQGTIGAEILASGAAFDAVFVPVGGGGLIAGIAAAIKAQRPEVKIIGVEPLDSAAMARARDAGQRIELGQVGIFADGVAVRQVGELTFSLCQALVDDYIQVDTDSICSSIAAIFKDTRAIVEPAGALSFAGAKAWLARYPGAFKSVVTINSGANMNFQRLRFVAERAEAGAGHECLLVVRLKDQAGALKDLCTRVLAGVSISELNYRSNGSDEAYVLLGLSLGGNQDKNSIIKRLVAADYGYRDLSDNEVAKEHLRHMVGGRAPSGLREELYSVVFPERPGALADFLAATSSLWNISLFHYRSHGADYGRVLLAFAVGELEREKLEEYLRRSAYPYTHETGNPAYTLLL